MKPPKYRTPVWVLAVLALMTMFFILFCIPSPAQSAETNQWTRTPDRPNQWRKELGPRMGDQVLTVEYGHGLSPMYIYLRRCGISKTFEVLAWVKGSIAHARRGCPKHSLPMPGTKDLEKQGGEIPSELIERLVRHRIRVKK